MSITKEEQHADIAAVIEKNSPTLSEVLINPIQYRTEILSAVRISHKEEIKNRYVHYDTRRDRGRLPIETSRKFFDSSGTIEIDVTIYKTGHRYKLEGNITDKSLCQSFTLFCYLKTIPARKSILASTLELQPNQTPSLLEFRERLIGLQLQLEEIRREQQTLMNGSYSQDPPPTPAQYQQQENRTDVYTHYPGQNYTPQRPDYPSPYQ